jgi:hypothetical protein
VCSLSQTRRGRGSRTRKKLRRVEGRVYSICISIFSNTYPRRLLKDDDTDSYIEDDALANEGVMPIRTAKEAHVVWGQFGGGCGGRGNKRRRRRRRRRFREDEVKIEDEDEEEGSPQANVSAVEMPPLEVWTGNPLIDDTHHHSRHKHHSVWGVWRGGSSAR